MASLRDKLQSFGIGSPMSQALSSLPRKIDTISVSVKSETCLLCCLLTAGRCLIRVSMGYVWKVRFGLLTLITSKHIDLLLSVK